MRQKITVSYREWRVTAELHEDDAPSSSRLPTAKVVDTTGETIIPRPLRKASGLHLVGQQAKRSA